MKRSISLLLVAVPFITVSLTAGEASGQFKVDGRRPITPKYAAAYESRDSRDGRKKVVEVVLSVTPLNVAEIATALDPHAMAINEDALKDDNYVLLWIRADGDVSMNATYSDSMMQFIDNTSESLKAELTTNTPDKVEGRIFTPKPVKTMGGEAYTVDLKFSTAVTRVPAGTKIAAGGGEPGAGFKKLLAAMDKKDWAGLKGAMTAEQAKSFDADYNTPEENLRSTLEILKAWLPKKSVKIVGGELRGDTAILEVEGEIFEGRNALYLVEMKKSDAKWVYNRSITAGLLKK